MKERDFVRVINSDSKYYGEEGTVINLRPSKVVTFVDVFLTKRKKQINFFKGELETLQRK